MIGDDYVDEWATHHRCFRCYFDLAANIPVYRITFEPGPRHLPKLLDTIEGLPDRQRA